MIIKPERVIKRIIKAVGERQSVLIVGNWQEELVRNIKEKQNSITQISDIGTRIIELTDNSFTRIVADYNLFGIPEQFFLEARRLLLPTGFIVITAHSELSVFEKIINFFKKKNNRNELQNLKLIPPKLLQNMVHSHGFLIDAYNGYPGGHLLMVAQIQNKEVSTLFASDKQETLRK